jgi:heparan-alpha-glucosaminide N-acetyltransferase
VVGRRREWMMGSLAILLLLHLSLQPFLPQGVEARKRRFDLDFPQRFAADVQSDAPRGKLFAHLDDKPWLAGVKPALVALADGIDELGRYVNVADAAGSLAAVTMAGCLLGTILRRDSDVRTHRARVRWTMTLIVGLFLAGAIADNFEGINEDAATATFCLWSAAIAAAVWLVLYLLVDAAGFRRGSTPLRLAGENPLVAYLLHPMVIWTIRLAGLEENLLAYTKAGHPWVILGSLAMAAAVCVLSGLVGRAGLRMRL